MTLTVKQIENAKAKDKPYKLSDGRGLYLYVSKTGVKSWRANYTENKKQKTITYGRYPNITLAEARILHANQKDSVNATTDTMTFLEASEKWLKIKLPTISNLKSQKQFVQSLSDYVYPYIGKLDISKIKRVELTNIVLKIQDKGKLETAKRVCGRITSIFNYAQDLGVIESHPATNLTRVLREKRIVKPMPSIPLSEV